MAKIVMQIIDGVPTEIEITDADHYRNVMSGRIRLEEGTQNVLYDNSTALDSEVEAEYIIFKQELLDAITAEDLFFETTKQAFIDLRDFNLLAVGAITGAGNNTQIISAVETELLRLNKAVKDNFKLWKYLHRNLGDVINP